MDVYTVSFFGHRIVENIPEVEKKLIKIVNSIVENNEYIRFLIGREGQFDWLVSSVISRIAYRKHNIYTILVLPYIKADYRDHKENYLLFYNEVEICEKSSQAYFKSAFKVRNRSMVDRSDLVVCCVQHKGGGAYQAVRYAQKQNCKIINIG